jgi:hypothetical protein
VNLQVENKGWLTRGSYRVKVKKKVQFDKAVSGGPGRGKKRNPWRRDDKW